MSHFNQIYCVIVAFIVVIAIIIIIITLTVMS